MAGFGRHLKNLVRILKRDNCRKKFATCVGFSVSLRSMSSSRRRPIPQFGSAVKVGAFAKLVLAVATFSESRVSPSLPPSLSLQPQTLREWDHWRHGMIITQFFKSCDAHLGVQDPSVNPHHTLLER